MRPVYVKGKKFDSAREASIELGIPTYSVIARVRSKRETWKDWSDKAPKRKKKKTS